jgi:hypothetical protein
MFLQAGSDASFARLHAGTKFLCVGFAGGFAYRLRAVVCSQGATGAQHGCRGDYECGNDRLHRFLLA